jgi:hypothetical protein
LQGRPTWLALEDAASHRLEHRSVCSSNESTHLRHSDEPSSGGPQRIHSAGGKGALGDPSQNKQNADGFKPFGVRTRNPCTSGVRSHPPESRTRATCAAPGRRPARRGPNELGRGMQSGARGTGRGPRGAAAQDEKRGGSLGCAAHAHAGARASKSSRVLVACAATPSLSPGMIRMPRHQCGSAEAAPRLPAQSNPRAFDRPLPPASRCAFPSGPSVWCPGAQAGDGLQHRARLRREGHAKSSRVAGRGGASATVAQHAGGGGGAWSVIELVFLEQMAPSQEEVEVLCRKLAERITALISPRTGSLR